MNSNQNPNCEGTHCLKSTSAVRVWNDIALCFDCSAVANGLRYVQKLPQIPWLKCEAIEDGWAWDSVRKAWIHLPS